MTFRAKTAKEKCLKGQKEMKKVVESLSFYWPEEVPVNCLPMGSD